MRGEIVAVCIDECDMVCTAAVAGDGGRYSIGHTYTVLGRLVVSAVVLRHGCYVFLYIINSGCVIAV